MWRGSGLRENGRKGRTEGQDPDDVRAWLHWVNEDLRAKYELWRGGIESEIVQRRVLTTFSHLPRSACTCQLLECQQRKIDTRLMACSHGVEGFLRASGIYNKEWLRRERLMWHPDRFGQRCDVDYRRELAFKAMAMYAIFEGLIVKEID